MQLPPWTANRTLLGLCTTLALAACTKEPPKPSVAPAPTAAAPAPTAATDTAAPTSAAAPGATAPVAPPPAPAGPALAGTVVETMNSGGYTYAKLDLGGGATAWVAGPETPLKVGAKIAKLDGTLMPNFRSETLNRTFDQIYFVGTYGMPGAAPDPHAAEAKTAPGAPAAAKVERAPGGKTIAEIFAGKDALAGKPVAVRGNVVKVNNGIMGRNWIHLQDGTGAAGTNDLTVTTSATAAKGDVVVVRGNVVINKDFGAGYSYPVLIEDAAIAAK